MDGAGAAAGAAEREEPAGRIRPARTARRPRRRRSGPTRWRRSMRRPRSPAWSSSATRPAPGSTLVQTSAGLNGALRDGAAFAAEQWPDDGIAALVGDLPALRAGRARRRAATQPALTDPPSSPTRAGQGTTLLAVRPGAVLQPRFGAGSAARHAEIAVALGRRPRPADRRRHRRRPRRGRAGRARPAHPRADRQ